MDELNNYYKNSLLGNLCGEYRGYWQSAHNDKLKLVRLALQQQCLPHLISYSYEGKGLSKEYILENFKGYINGNYIGINVDGVDGDYKSELYVGFNGILTLCDDVLCTMWSTIPYLTLPTCKAAKIYCGCSSNLQISCDGFNNIIIMLFDDSQIELTDFDETCSATIYKYSNDCKVDYGRFCLSKNIHEHQKELRL